MKKCVLLLILLLSAAAFAEELPKITVYVTGDIADGEKKALGASMLVSIVNSGRYMEADNSASFLAEAEKERQSLSGGALNNSRISELARRFGIDAVCVTDVTSAFGAFQLSARIVDAATAQAAFIANATSPLKTITDLELVSDKVVGNMFSGKEPASARKAARAEREREREQEQDYAPSDTGDASRKSKPHKFVLALDMYNTIKYMPIASPVYFNTYYFETGWIGRSGIFYGLDVYCGLAEKDTVFYQLGNYQKTGRVETYVGGLGINVGKVHYLPDNISFAYGGSLGAHGTIYEIFGTGDSGMDGAGWFLGGPFVRLRWYFAEISYRVLFGSNFVKEGSGEEQKLRLSHQLGIGLYFEGKKNRVLR